MKNFFNRRDEIEEVVEDDLDIINLDETAEWSKLDVAEEMAKKQAAGMMAEIGEELAAMDAVEEEIEIKELRSETIKKDTYTAPKRVVLQELPEETTEEHMEELGEEDIEYLSDDEEDEEEVTTFGEKVANFFGSWTVFDKIVAVTGVLVLAVAVVTAGAYTVDRKVEQQIAAFAPIGEQLEGLGETGYHKLVAVADAKKVLMEVAKLEQTQTQEKQDEQSNQHVIESETVSEVKVVMKMTSVEKDLKMKFVNKKDGKLVKNVPFEVQITDSENKTYNKKDDDQDGIIYLKGIPAGSYSVSMVELSDVEGYSFSTSAQSIHVKDKIVYEKIDVTEEIKNQNEVDVSKEDTAQKVETEKVLTDTVEWVESGKQEQNTQETYVQISKDTIADPALSASLNLDLDILRVMRQSVMASNIMPMDENGDSGNNGGGNSDEGGNNEGGDGSGEGGNNEGGNGSGEGGSNEGGNGPGEGGNNEGGNGSGEGGNNEGGNGSGEGGNNEGGNGSGEGGNNNGGTGSGDGGKDEGEDKPKPPTEPETIPATSVSLNFSELSLEQGSGNTLTVEVLPKNTTDKTEWTTSNEKVATVKDGKVTAVGVGEAAITVKAGSKSATCKIKVTEKKIEVSGISISETLSLKKGESGTLSVKFTPENPTDKTVTWESSDEKVATVKDGKVTAVAKGTAKITVTSNNGKKAACTVTVTEDAVSVTEVTLNKTKLEIKVDGSETLKATVKPDNATNKELIWTSSDDAIVKVDKDGKVTGVKEGTAKIIVITKDKEKKATCDVTVKPRDPKVTMEKKEATVKVGETLTLKVKVTIEGKPVEWKSSDEKLATVKPNGEVTAKAKGKVTITATCDGDSTTCEVTIKEDYDAKSDTTTSLKDKSGNQVYVLVDGKYVEAKAADYYKYDTFYIKQSVGEVIYTGWQNIDGRTYYFDKNGNKVTGEQTIQGAKYNFNSDGTLNTGSGILGIDVSTWNGTIDWNKVKNSGVSYVIIRTGFRGSTQGALIEDNRFRQNIQGATNAGLKVGVYFFSQAINEVEAIEEASMVLSQVKGYNLAYPVFIDVEPSGGRADGLSSGDRTKVINAFCQTIQNGGYKAGIYANKTWLAQKMNVSALSGYKIWLAQYNDKVTYTGRYDVWQYSDKGTVSGISGKVDMNLSYLTY